MYLKIILKWYLLKNIVISILYLDTIDIYTETSMYICNKFEKSLVLD